MIYAIFFAAGIIAGVVLDLYYSKRVITYLQELETNIATYITHR